MLSEEEGPSVYERLTQATAPEGEDTEPDAAAKADVAQAPVVQEKPSLMDRLLGRTPSTQEPEQVEQGSEAPEPPVPPVAAGPPTPEAPPEQAVAAPAEAAEVPAPAEEGPPTPVPVEAVDILKKKIQIPGGQRPSWGVGETIQPSETVPEEPEPQQPNLPSVTEPETAVETAPQPPERPPAEPEPAEPELPPAPEPPAPEPPAEPVPPAPLPPVEAPEAPALPTPEAERVEFDEVLAEAKNISEVVDLLDGKLSGLEASASERMRQLNDLSERRADLQEKKDGIDSQATADMRKHLMFKEVIAAAKTESKSLGGEIVELDKQIAAAEADLKVNEKADHQRQLEARRVRKELAKWRNLAENPHGLEEFRRHLNLEAELKRILEGSPESPEIGTELIQTFEDHGIETGDKLIPELLQDVFERTRQLRLGLPRRLLELEGLMPERRRPAEMRPGLELTKEREEWMDRWEERYAYERAAKRMHELLKLPAETAEAGEATPETEAVPAEVEEPPAEPEEEIPPAPEPAVSPPPEPAAPESVPEPPPAPEPQEPPEEPVTTTPERPVEAPEAPTTEPAEVNEKELVKHRENLEKGWDNLRQALKAEDFESAVEVVKGLMNSAEALKDKESLSWLHGEQLNKLVDEATKRRLEESGVEFDEAGKVKEIKAGKKEAVGLLVTFLLWLGLAGSDAVARSVEEALQGSPRR